MSATDVVGKSLTEEFMAACYEFRRNVLSDKYEMREVTEPSAEEAALPENPWRTVTRESINTIARRTKRELGKKFGSKTCIEEYIYSEETPDYDPIAEYLSKLPAWDGQDRERDQIKAGKQPELKQLVSKIIVNGRPIFGRVQRERLRYASFVATTNNPRPLQDKTGSRRYLCIQIPQDSIICNDRPIDYEQLYAQVLYEVREQKLPYWFTPAETRQIEEQNVKFQHVDDLESMLIACFRHPEAEEIVRPLMTSEVVGILAKNYPEMKVTTGMNVKVGRLLSALNFERKVVAKGTVYYIVPMKKSA